MKKITLFSVIAFSALMVGCSSTQSRDNAKCDLKACDTKQCDDAANCDPSKCDKPECPKQAKACPTGAKACGADCTKPCCASKSACTHPNSTFECAKCEPGKPCCPDCASKAAASCPDCTAKAAHACPDCKDGVKCEKCAA